MTNEQKEVQELRDLMDRFLEMRIARLERELNRAQLS